MSSYPVHMHITRFRHKGGTKFYEIRRFKSQAGADLVSFRWGKVGAFGQIQFIRANSLSQALKIVEDKIRDREKGGYSVEKEDNRTLTDAQSFKGDMMPYTQKMGASLVQYLVPEYDITGLRDDAETVWLDEDGKRIDAASRAKEEAARLLAEQKAAEEKASLDKMRDLPTFGMFG